MIIPPTFNQEIMARNLARILCVIIVLEGAVTLAKCGEFVIPTLLVVGLNSS